MCQINIRDVQHYLYCAHRWGLMKIDCAWAENYFVAKANLQHNRVHEQARHTPTKGKTLYTGVLVYNDLPAYDLLGVTDCIELTKTTNGNAVSATGDRCTFCIVEHKPTQPKQATYHEEDALQVFAQKVCVDYVFGCDCDAVLYYANTKQRVPLPFRERYAELDEKLKQTLVAMRKDLREGYIPPRIKGTHCNGCSLRDMCMPSANHQQSIRENIRKLLEV